MKPSCWALTARLGLVLAVSAAAGCGGSRVFGVNSDVYLTLEGRRLDDLVLIVSEKMGPPSASDACRTDARSTDPDWCDAYLTVGSDEIEFTTNSDASEKPFYVYVQNQSDEDTLCTVRVLMEASSDITEDIVTFEIYGNETVKVYEVLRNNWRRVVFD